MIGLSDSSKINGAPGNFLVPLEIFYPCKDSNFLRTIPILDGDIVIMCRTDLIGCDNIGTKGFRLGHIAPRELVSD